MSIELKNALSLCKISPFVPSAIHLTNKEDNETILLDVETGKFSTQVDKEIPNTSKLSAALYIKDKCVVSDRAYQEFSQITANLPRMYELKMLAKVYDDESVSSDGVIGVQQTLHDCIKVRLLHIFKTTQQIPTKLSVKLSGDGTHVARSMHVINFTFT
jgi:hypothetical protein